MGNVWAQAWGRGWRRLRPDGGHGAFGTPPARHSSRPRSGLPGHSGKVAPMASAESLHPACFSGLRASPPRCRELDRTCSMVTRTHCVSDTEPERPAVCGDRVRRGWGRGRALAAARRSLMPGAAVRFGSRRCGLRTDMGTPG